MAFFVVSAGAMTGLVATAPEPSGKVALVYAPYVTTDEALRRAVSTGALPIRQGNVDWIVVVAPPPDDQNFSAKAHISGALAILNPVIAGGCSPDSSSAKDSTYRRSQ